MNLPRDLRAAFTALTLAAAGEAASSSPAIPAVGGSGLDFRYEVRGGRLRAVSLLPHGMTADWTEDRPSPASGVEVALQVTGQNWDEHHGQKLIGGSPGVDLRYVGQHDEPSRGGHDTVLTLQDATLQLIVESHYQFFEGIPVVRRWTRVINHGAQPVGLEHVSSAMLYRLGNFGAGGIERKLRIDHASNTWQCEAQWRSDSPAQLGYTDNGSFNVNAISFSNLGGWSTMTDLPEAMVENRAIGVTWFWQIEHDGAWHWELGNTGNRMSYVYLGGPDELHAQAWKELQPGAAYETVPVAVGCVRGGFQEGTAALTAYRRQACLQPNRDNHNCPVIFNDYMNCLGGDPTAAKELPLIDAAARAGCEYYVIDAGWYAEQGETWWDTVGLWRPSHTRWGPDGTAGLKMVLDRIRARGMVPGLWLEIEVAGIKSPLKQKPDAWFFMRHGKRVIDHGRYFLDFRNPEVRAHADEVVNRLVRDYGVGYIKMDYNEDALLGTETAADSFGQGLLEHQRAYLHWIDAIHGRFPALVIENCGSGGGRMDYAMLSHHQLQSSSDQTDYRKYPAIVAGGLAAVLPEQFAVWNYPLTTDSVDAASFNMVNALLGRIHQSGPLADLPPASRHEVTEALNLYKTTLRAELPRMTSFLPLGFAAMADEFSPIAVGLKDDRHAFVAVWRLAGAKEVVSIDGLGQNARILYPTDRGITIQAAGSQTQVRFPRPYMAALLEVQRR